MTMTNLVKASPETCSEQACGLASGTKLDAEAAFCGTAEVCSPAEYGQVP